MDALPLGSDADESVIPWSVRETLLNTGLQAALYTEQWGTALSLNGEIAKATLARGADKLEVAGTRFNDYGPLLGLRRYDEARALLLSCRAVFEAERHIEFLGKVYCALAALEDKTGGRAAAVRFEQVALGYKYHAGQPEACAVSHHNLANYLDRQGADPATILAHRLAAATILLQMQSGQLQLAVYNLANADLPPAPPAFAEVIQRVEAIEGVGFRSLFERLPRTAPDGDTAIAAVWQEVTEEKLELAEQKRVRDALLASTPGTVRESFE
jgi:hypothetical protein